MRANVAGVAEILVGVWKVEVKEKWILWLLLFFVGVVWVDV